MATDEERKAKRHETQRRYRHKNAESIAAKQPERMRQWRLRNAERIKECAREYRRANSARIAAKRRAHYLDNAESIKAKAREYYRSVAPARKAEYMREWRRDNAARIADYTRANAERFKAYNREWRRKNADAIRSVQREWERNNVDKVRALKRKNAAIRKSRKLALFVEPVDHLKVFDRDGGICRICGRACERAETKSWHIDHIIPLAKGGAHAYANVQLAHARCNIVKSAKMPHELSCSIMNSTPLEGMSDQKT